MEFLSHLVAPDEAGDGTVRILYSYLSQFTNDLVNHIIIIIIIIMQLYKHHYQKQQQVRMYMLIIYLCILLLYRYKI